jgi:hypothetical protein
LSDAVEGTTPLLLGQPDVIAADKDTAESLIDEER